MNDVKIHMNNNGSVVLIDNPFRAYPQKRKSLMIFVKSMESTHLKINMKVYFNSLSAITE